MAGGQDGAPAKEACGDKGGRLLCGQGTDARRRDLYHEDRAGSGDGHVSRTSQGERHPVFFRADAQGGRPAVSDDTR